ncbi:MAG: hypothetical protein EOP09_03260 [Proteobacteria bacterium]|nr:MAG: hypothetical protein EOP09_03260 [Pseudomonadota bacterium]
MLENQSRVLKSQIEKLNRFAPVVTSSTAQPPRDVLRWAHGFLLKPIDLDPLCRMIRLCAELPRNQHPLSGNSLTNTPSNDVHNDPLYC